MAEQEVLFKLVAVKKEPIDMEEVACVSHRVSGVRKRPQAEFLPRTNEDQQTTEKKKRRMDDNAVFKELAGEKESLKAWIRPLKVDFEAFYDESLLRGSSGRAEIRSAIDRARQRAEMHATYKHQVYHHFVFYLEAGILTGLNPKALMRRGAAEAMAGAVAATVAAFKEEEETVVPPAVHRAPRRRRATIDDSFEYLSDMAYRSAFMKYRRLVGKIPPMALGGCA